MLYDVVSDTCSLFLMDKYLITISIGVAITYESKQNTTVDKKAILFIH